MFVNEQSDIWGFSKSRLGFFSATSNTNVIELNKVKEANYIQAKGQPKQIIFFIAKHASFNSATTARKSYKAQ